MMVNSKALLKKALIANQLNLAEDQQDKLIVYLALLQKWNRVFNLTAITDIASMIDLHLIDSLLVQPDLQGTRLLDVGSGGGLPGIPLAIVNPQQTWTLLDKNGKKTRFLQQAVATLQLGNVEVVQNNADHFQPTHCFDSIVSRAFGTLALFTTSTAHLLCDGGTWLALKGKYPQDELAELTTQYVIDVKPITPVFMQHPTVTRHIVLIRKGKTCG